MLLTLFSVPLIVIEVLLGRSNDRQPAPERGPRMNEQIRISPIRVIGAAGEQLGLMPTSQALEKAREAGLDVR